MEMAGYSIVQLFQGYIRRGERAPFFACFIFGTILKYLEPQHQELSRQEEWFKKPLGQETWKENK